MSCDWRFLLNFLSLSRYAWEERKLGDFIKISREQEVKKVDLHEEKIGYYVLAMRTFERA
ncbi:hypothetical protein FEM49_03314 (plasmid) [Lactiplantibacillus plantarum]|nr:hypothetical protein FEM49_03314 [Lactiplantibacillus plantarum]